MGDRQGCFVVLLRLTRTRSLRILTIVSGTGAGRRFPTSYTGFCVWKHCSTSIEAIYARLDGYYDNYQLNPWFTISSRRAFFKLTNKFTNTINSEFPKASSFVLLLIAICVRSSLAFSLMFPATLVVAQIECGHVSSILL